VSGTARWVAQAAAVGLSTGVDSRGLVHVVIDDAGWRSCQQTGDGYGSATGPVTATTRVCLWCRELPGRERHARKVLS
jgi:hypothetical protein